jgi:hypothetical protein
MTRRILSTGLDPHPFNFGDGLMDNRLIALAAFVLTGCAATTAVPKDAAAAPAMITGTVTYRERIALPPTAVIKVQLVDVSRADAPAVVIGVPLFSVPKVPVETGCSARAPRSLRAHAHEFRWVSVPRKALKFAEQNSAARRRLTVKSALDFCRKSAAFQRTGIYSESAGWQGRPL